MFKIEAKKVNNLLKIQFSGNVDAKETQAGLEPLRNSLGELSAGFRLLSDLTGLLTMETACTPHIRQAMDWCNEKGVSLVVRVIPDPHLDVGLNILSIFHYRRGVRIVTVETLEEATRVLIMTSDEGRR